MRITDLNYLKTMSGNDEEFISEMISLFREQVEEYKNQMPVLLAEKSYLDLSRLAHKAKSSVAVMGMAQVAELLKEFEDLALEGREPEKYEGMIVDFLAKCEKALIELEQF